MPSSQHCGHSSASLAQLIPVAVPLVTAQPVQADASTATLAGAPAVPAATAITSEQCTVAGRSVSAAPDRQPAAQQPSKESSGTAQRQRVQSAAASPSRSGIDVSKHTKSKRSKVERKWTRLPPGERARAMRLCIKSLHKKVLNCLI